MCFRLQGAIHSVLACRIILNIRKAAVQDQTGGLVGLHSGYEEMRFVDQLDEDFD
jgi:hypothetical protein